MYVVAARLASAMRAPPMLSLVSIARIETRLIALLLEAATASDLTSLPPIVTPTLVRSTVPVPGGTDTSRRTPSAVGCAWSMVAVGATASTAYDGEATPRPVSASRTGVSSMAAQRGNRWSRPAVHRNSMVAKIRGSTVTLLCCIFSRNFGRRPVAFSEPRERPSRSKPAELS